MLAALLLAAALAADPPAHTQTAPPRELARGVHFIPGAFLPGRGPDGNTVVFDAPEGLVVIDTGRHAWHAQAILEFAQARRRPIAAILNTHWHLDHATGNARLRAAFPNAPLYATSAVDAALAPNGFLVRNLASARAMAADASIPATQREEVQIFITTMETPQTLRPTITIDRSQRLRIAGRRFDLRVTDGAVTAADLWLYDRRSRIAVIGDLVTFPAPFFETACPERWRAALDQVWATPFRIAVPGHGAPMTRAQFDAWRTAYNAFIDCARADTAPAQCAAAWSANIAPFIADDEHAQRAAPQMAEYYVTFLRSNAGKSPDCAAS
jgi:glyoxylase-like metal-dependent hydrolase (beta-lactamase superfamily II)